MGLVAIIFGGTRGIGKAIALKFRINGYRVAITSRQKANVTAATTQLENTTSEGENGGQILHPVMGFQCDVTCEQSVRDCLKYIEEKWSTPSVIVNAAGINEDRLLIKTNTFTMHSIVNTNLIGAMITSKMAAQTMMKKRFGSIINIGSIVGLHGNYGQVAYSSSKAGLVGLTKSLAKELGNRGIRVNLIAPGFVDTEMTAALKQTALLQSLIPLHRFGTPEEVAEVAHFLATATYITGEVFVVDGGLHLNL